MRTVFPLASNASDKSEREPDPLKGSVEVPQSIVDGIGAYVAEMAASNNPAVERGKSNVTVPAYRLAPMLATLPGGERVSVSFGFRGALTLSAPKAPALATLPPAPANLTAEEMALYASLQAKLSK